MLRARRGARASGPKPARGQPWRREAWACARERERGSRAGGGAHRLRDAEARDEVDHLGLALDELRRARPAAKVRALLLRERQQPIGVLPRARVVEALALRVVDVRVEEPPANLRRARQHLLLVVAEPLPAARRGARRATRRRRRRGRGGGGCSGRRLRRRRRLRRGGGWRRPRAVLELLGALEHGLDGGAVARLRLLLTLQFERLKVVLGRRGVQCDRLLVAEALLVGTHRQLEAEPALCKRCRLGRVARRHTR